jgi:hypothetical protein
MVDLGADPQRALDALMKWWAHGVRFAAYRSRDVAALVEILCAGGAVAHDSHKELATTAGNADVVAALNLT